MTEQISGLRLRSIRAFRRDWVRMGGLLVPQPGGLCRVLRAPYPTPRARNTVYDRWQHDLWTRNSKAAHLLFEEAGTAGDVHPTYAASSNVTVTNLNSLASSQTWVAGWEGAAVDNTSNLYLNAWVTCKLTVASANNQAGEIRLYEVMMLDDSTWPDVFDGTESTETITDTEMRDAICMMAGVTAVDTTTADVYYIPGRGAREVFGDMPAKFVPFITGNPTTTTTAGLAASGNQVTVKGLYANVAAA